MNKQNRNDPVESSQVCYDTLEQWTRVKVQEFVQQLLQEAVASLLGREKHARRESVSPVDPPGGSRNGYGKPRRFSMMNGTITVQRPRVRDLEERFVSKILPLFKRRTQAVGDLLPELYLHGLSTGDFELALRDLLGEGAPLSASSIQRLKARFELEYKDWKEQDLSSLEVVYAWADGLYVKAGIEDRKAALLVIVGALSTGEKVLLACESGERESKESWLKVLRDLKARGLKLPRLTVADGHLGIWAALPSCTPTVPSSVAGTTSSSTCSTTCPRRNSRAPPSCSRPCPTRPPRPSASACATPSPPVTRRPTPRPSPRCCGTGSAW